MVRVRNSLKKKLKSNTFHKTIYFNRMKSKLHLSSGEIFTGISPDWQEDIYFGEVVFSTGMTGYTESLTDPSYTGQILVFTYPLIGNYGVPNKEKWESEKIHAAGVIANDVTEYPSHYETKKSFSDWLKDQKIPLITGIDTRALTLRLRDQGSLLGAICKLDQTPDKFIDPNENHLVKKVSPKCAETYRHKGKKLIIIDCGMKENILRNFLKYPLNIKRVPFDYDFTNEEYDAVFISNGPGDPVVCKETIEIIKKVLNQKKPTFGICLGSQLIALSIGAKTYKLKFGHRSQNQPCFDEIKRKSILTSQNHGYAIDEKTLPNDWMVYFRNLNDCSIEGIKHKNLPFFAVQFHPESSPGPLDSEYLFNEFYKLIEGE